MAKYFMGRNTGKTSTAYILSIETGKHILTYSPQAKKNLEDRAKRDGVNLPTVYLPCDIINVNTNFITCYKDLIIDEAQLVLDCILNYFNCKSTIQFYGVE